MAVKTTSSKMVASKRVATKNPVKDSGLDTNFVTSKLLSLSLSSIFAEVIQAPVALYTDSSTHNFPSVRR